MTKGRATLGAYVRCLAGQARARFSLGVALLILTGLLEGGGLLMILPILKAIGIGTGAGAGPAGWAAAVMRRGGIPEGLRTTLAIFVGIKLVQAVFRAWSGALNVRLESDFTCHLRERFYRALVRSDWRQLSRQRGSDITQTLMGEIAHAGSGIQAFMLVLSLTVVAAVQFATAVALSWPAAAVALLSAATVTWGFRRLRRQSLALGETSRRMQAEMASVVTEHMAGLKIAKSHGREHLHFERFRRAMHGIAAHARQAHRVNSAAGLWMQAGSVIAMALLVAFAVGVARVSPARLLVIAFIFSRLQPVQTSLQSTWLRLMQALPAFAATERLRGELEAAAEPAEPAHPRRISLERGVVLERVSYRYDPDLPAAVEGLDLVIPARQIIALCGPSGAGKSTVADLILGLIAPTSGRVLVDGLPLDGTLLHDWRRSIGYVPQETFLFHDTLRANLRWARPEASEAELRLALRTAAAEDFALRLPRGLDTVLGDRGFRLSGGERQRLALARALLRHPTLLVLDEATSALDAENDRMIQEAIGRLHGELAVVIIAHRLSTVRMADRIAVLREGRLVESGAWDDLAGREDGAFRQLLAAGG